MQFLMAQGFDEQLYPMKWKTFVLTIHSLDSLAISIEDATDPEFAYIDDQVNLDIIKKYGKVAEKKLGQYTLWVKEYPENKDSEDEDEDEKDLKNYFKQES